MKLDAPRPSMRMDGTLPNDRPTPRSTVIPRLPGHGPLPGMRPPLETLIFHGAPPLPPPSPKSLVFAPPPSRREDAFQDVHSTELLEDAEEDDADLDATESERPTPYQESGSARTERPPSFASMARPRGLPREVRVIAGLAVAIAAPILLAFVIDRPSPHATSPTVTVRPPPAATTPAPAPRIVGSCSVDGAPHLLARRALVRGGVEATTLDERVAFAALTSIRSGTAYELDARTLAVRSSAKVVAADPVRHVVPELGEDAPIEAQADTGAFRTVTDSEGDSAIGVRDGFVVWGPRDGDGMVRLWKLPWPQVIDAPRIAPLGTSGERVISFRREGALWVGSFRGGQATSDLTRLSTSSYVGVPTLDAHGEEAVIAWAQRDSAASPWGIRWIRWTPHAGPGALRELALPPGGPGDRAMAPSVSALEGGRFLLAWTEAGHGRNQVRAQVFDVGDHPLGNVLGVSPQDVIAGQEQIALTDSGRGAIAYLVARRGAFELRATAIDCASTDRP